MQHERVRQALSNYKTASKALSRLGLDESTLTAATTAVLLTCTTSDPVQLPQYLLSCLCRPATRVAVEPTLPLIVPILASLIPSASPSALVDLLTIIQKLSFPPSVDVSPLSRALLSVFTNPDAPLESQRGAVLALYHIHPDHPLPPFPASTIQAALALQARISICSSSDALDTLVPEIESLLDAPFAAHLAATTALARAQVLRVWASRVRLHRPTSVTAVLARVLQLVAQPLTAPVALDALDALMPLVSDKQALLATLDLDTTLACLERLLPYVTPPPDLARLALSAVLERSAPLSYARLLALLPARDEGLALVAEALLRGDERCHERVLPDLLAACPEDANVLLSAVRGHVWAELCVLHCLEKGGAHVACLAGPRIAVGLAWAVSPEYLQAALEHESERVRAVAWALVSTRKQASQPVEAAALACVTRALPRVWKAHEGFAKDRLREALARIAPRTPPEWRAWLADTAARCLYPRSPIARVDLALFVLGLLPGPPSPSVQPSLVWLVAHAPFDASRAAAFELLRRVGPLLPPLPLRDEPWLGRMRRNADQGAKLLGLAFAAGQLVDVPPSPRHPCSAADRVLMRLARREAQRCIPVPTAYCVGAVAVDEAGRVVASGFSRELPGNTHAEECALAKASATAPPHTVYTTMEPCSARLSGLRSCTSRLIEAGVKRVVVGVPEPPDFVACEGTRLLREAGVAVEYIADAGVRAECADLALPEDAAAFQRDLDETRRLLLARAVGLVRAALSDTTPLPGAGSTKRGLQATGVLRGPLPLHGPLMVLRCMLGELPEEVRVHAPGPALTRAQLRDEVAGLCKVALEACDVALAASVAGAYDPSPQELDEDEEVHSWLGLREGAELLGDCAAHPALPDGEVGAVTEWFLSALLELRHLGAVAHVARGLERAAASLARRDAGALARVTARALEQVEVAGADKALRRSEGLALGLRALMRAGRAEVLGHCLAAARGPRAEPRVHALNVLRALFLDARLAAACRDALGPALEVAVDALGAGEWKVRNAGLSLFAAACGRGVGAADNSWREGRHPPLSRAPSAAALFALHPAALVALEAHLDSAPHPVLVLLSMLRRGEGVLGDKVRALLASPEWLVRAAAARALLAGTRESDAPQTLESLAEAAVGGANAQHGALLAMRELVRAGAVLPPRAEQQLRCLRGLPWPCRALVRELGCDEQPDIPDDAGPGRTRFLVLARLPDGPPAARLAHLEALPPSPALPSQLWPARLALSATTQLHCALLRLLARCGGDVGSDWREWALDAATAHPCSAVRAAALGVLGPNAPQVLVRDMARSDAPLVCRLAAAGVSPLGSLALVTLLVDDDVAVREEARHRLPEPRPCLALALERAFEALDVARGDVLDWLVAQFAVQQRSKHYPRHDDYAPDDSNTFVEYAVMVQLAARALRRARAERLAIAGNDVRAELGFWQDLAVRACCDLRACIEGRANDDDDDKFEARFKALALAWAAADCLDPDVHELALRSRVNDHPLLARATSELLAKIRGGPSDFDSL